MNEEIWKVIRNLEQEVAMLKALITKSPNIKITTTGGKMPEVDFSPEENLNAPWKAEDATFKNTRTLDSSFGNCYIRKNPCNHVYSAQTEICVSCGEHISIHRR